MSAVVLLLQHTAASHLSLPCIPTGPAPCRRRQPRPRLPDRCCAGGAAHRLLHAGKRWAVHWGGQGSWSREPWTWDAAMGARWPAGASEHLCQAMPLVRRLAPTPPIPTPPPQKRTRLRPRARQHTHTHTYTHLHLRRCWAPPRWRWRTRPWMCARGSPTSRPGASRRWGHRETGAPACCHQGRKMILGLIPGTLQWGPPAGCFLPAALPSPPASTPMPN